MDRRRTLSDGARPHAVRTDTLTSLITYSGNRAGGWSGSGTFALAVAAQSDAVTAVAPFEPGS
ncbi:hypothetical protein GCM10025762_33700 [Haloechinothrix salitolerans]